MYRISRVSSAFRDSKRSTLTTGQKQYNNYNQKDGNQSHVFTLLHRAAMAWSIMTLELIGLVALGCSPRMIWESLLWKLIRRRGFWSINAKYCAGCSNRF